MPLEIHRDFYGQLTFETWTPGSVGANTTVDQVFTAGVPGTWLLTDQVLVIHPQLPTPNPAGLIVAGAYVSALDQLTVRFANLTALAITPTVQGVYTVVVFRR